MKDHLINAGAERLAGILLHLQEACPELKKQFEMIFQGLESNLKKLTSMIKKDMTALKKAKAPVRDPKMRALRDRLNQLVFSITHDIKRSSLSTAQGLLWEFLELDSTTLNRLQDHHTTIFSIFKNASRALGELYKEDTGDKVEDLVQLLFDFIMREDCPSYEQITFDFKDALGAQGLDLLQSKLYAAANLRTILLIKPKLKNIADCKKDIDLYIQASQLITPATPTDCLDIGEKLIEKWKADEALEWIAKSEIGVPHALQQREITLRIQALELNGDYLQAQTSRIEYFIKTLDIWMYGEVLKYARGEEKASFIKQALEYAFHHEDAYTSLTFLMDMQELAEAGRFVCTHIHRIYLDYPLLLKKWAQLLIPVSPLAAALIYRKCVDSSFGSYYDIARDLIEYEGVQAQIIDWQGHEEHATYHAKIKNKYLRDYNFDWAYKYEYNRYMEKQTDK